MAFKVGYGLGDVSGCCGITQVHSFSEYIDDDDDSYDEWDIDEISDEWKSNAKGKTLEEAYMKLFDLLRKELPYGNVMQAWFVKHRRFDNNYEDNFKAEDFRKLIAGIPGVLDLGEFRNKNSGNIIHGYQWEQV